MRLPQRVPWSTPTELEQLFAWIYADEDELSSKVSAINRLSAWKASTGLPHALESTLSLLTVILQDERTSSSSSTHVPPLLLRQSYALALIRLVNGLVDPLQQGAFARSIAAIAAQIGLPLWLVELRHASTHENLPSLELLREGARDAMAWLLHNYFLPTLSPVNQPTNAPTLSPLALLLTQYKQLLKMTTRDTSLKSRFKPELVKILREVEGWIVEAKVSASMMAQYNDEDERERWALERMCDALVGRGGLVPVSKRKRPSPSQPLAPPIPQYVSLWSPLILHVHSLYSSFPSVLLSRIISHILSPAGAETASPLDSAPAGGIADPTYDHTLATWALWIVQQWGDDPNAECDRTDVLKELLVGLGRGDRRAGRALVNAIAEQDENLSEVVGLLTTTIQSSGRVSKWEDDALNTMSSRLSSLASHEDGAAKMSPDRDIEMSVEGSGLNPPSQTAKGWKLLQEGEGWRPCPIGVFIQ